MSVALAAAIALLFANGFFVAVEFSLARVRPTQVADFEREGRAGAGSVRHGVERIDAYLAACQLGITISSLGLGALAEPSFEHLLEPALGDAAIVGGIGMAAALALLIVTALHVVIGELSPKSLAIARTSGTVLALLPLMRVFYVTTRPLVDIFNWMGNLLLRPFGIPPASEVGHAPHSERELRELLHQSAREGMIDPQESRFSENVLLFGDRRAREVMTPRPEVDVVSTDDDVTRAIEVARRTGHTRLPLCRPAGLDEVVGVIHAKDLLRVADDEGVELAELARPLQRVPDGGLLDELLRRLRAERQHLALVVDEHGTAVGVITLEDILEEIVGEIEDEFDIDAEPDLRVEDGHLVVNGTAPVRLVAERIGLEVGEHREATIGGLVVERLGRVPEVGEWFDLEGCRAQALRTGEGIVELLRFEVPEAPAAREAESSD